jgi:hypothetical protein
MDEIAFLVAIVLGYQLIRSLLDRGSKERLKRLEALEAALSNPSIDRATVQQLTSQLTGTKSPQERAGAGLAWLLALGWMTLFSGAGVWVYGFRSDEKSSTAAGMLVMLIGFGLVTYPFALREMEARRAPR